MSISYVLVLLGLLIFGCAVWALFWAIDDGQYDDVEAHGRAIFDDESNPDLPANAEAPRTTPTERVPITRAARKS